MTSHYENRMREIARGRQKDRESLLRCVARLDSWEAYKPPKADSKALLHIAACLRRRGNVRFADVIERCAAELAKHE